MLGSKAISALPTDVDARLTLVLPRCFGDADGSRGGQLDRLMGEGAAFRVERDQGVLTVSERPTRRDPLVSQGDQLRRYQGYLPI